MPTYYSDKYPSPNTSYVDKYSTQGNVYNDKYQSGLTWNDLVLSWDSYTMTWDDLGGIIYANKYTSS